MRIFVAFAYIGLFLATLLCILLADILIHVQPDSAMLPFLAILCISMVLPMIVTRRGKDGP